MIMTESKRLDLYTSIVSNERQLKIQQMPFYAFVFGRLKQQIICDSLTLKIIKSRKETYIDKIEVCKTGGYRL